MSLVFRENAKNHQNHSVFEGAVLGVNSFFWFVSLWWTKFCKPQISLTKRIKYLSFITKKLLIIKLKAIFCFKSDGLTLASLIWPNHTIFPGNIFYVKRPIRNYKNYNHNFEFMTWGVVGSRGGVLLKNGVSIIRKSLWQIIYLQLIGFHHKICHAITFSCSNFLLTVHFCVRNYYLFQSATLAVAAAVVVHIDFAAWLSTDFDHTALVGLDEPLVSW